MDELTRKWSQIGEMKASISEAERQRNLAWKAGEDKRKASSPIKLRPGRDIVFSDVESVSTIPSRVQIHKDPDLIEAGLIKLKERILEQKMRKGGSSYRSSADNSNSTDGEVKFISPEDFSIKKQKFRSTADSVNNAPRTRKVGKAPEIEPYAGFNETQQVSRPVSRTNVARAVPPPPPQSGAVKPERQRKQVSGEQTKKALITTSSWRKGASITRKVLGDKTQAVIKSSSDRSSTSTSSKSPRPKAPTTRLTSPPKSLETDKKQELLSKKDSKVKKFPIKRKERNPSNTSVPKVKSRHYDSGEVQKYIERTKSERRKQMSKEKLEKEKAEKEKAQKLQQLFEFQKKAVQKSIRINKTEHDKENEEALSVDNATEGQQRTPIPELVSPGGFSDIEIPFIKSQQTDAVSESFPEEDHEHTLEADEEDTNAAQNERTTPLQLLYKDELDKSRSDINVRQREKMESIRRAALALSQKIIEEKNRLAAESRKSNLISELYQEEAPEKLPTQEERVFTRQENIISPHSSNSKMDDEETISFASISSSSLSHRCLDNNERQYLLDPPVVEPFIIPCQPDPYSVINIYAKRRKLEENRIKEEQVRREKESLDLERRYEQELEMMKRERQKEQERLKEIELELERDKMRLKDTRNRSIMSVGIDADQSFGLLASKASRSLDNTESLLRTTDEEEDGVDGELVDLSGVSHDLRSGVSLSEGFSENSSIEDKTPSTKNNENAMFSPQTLERKFQGEFARYETYSMGIEHLDKIEHIKTLNEEQNDTKVLAKSLKESRKDHESDIHDIQSKMQQDMLKLKERLNSLQTQAILQRAHEMNQETEAKIKRNEELQAKLLEDTLLDIKDTTHKIHDKVHAPTSVPLQKPRLSPDLPDISSQENTDLERTLTAIKDGVSEGFQTPESKNDYPSGHSTPKAEHLRASVSSETIKSEISRDAKSSESEVSKISEAPKTEISKEEPESPISDYLKDTGTPKTEYSNDFESPNLNGAEASRFDYLANPETPKTEYSKSPETPKSDYFKDAETPKSEYSKDAVTPKSDNSFLRSPTKDETSFRYVLPSESHRKRMSDQESITSGASCRQDSFAAFTLNLVDEFVRDEKARAKHRHMLIELTTQAVNEDIDTKMSWIRRKKKKYRKKGEDEKMPAVLKKEKSIIEEFRIRQKEIDKLHRIQRQAEKERRNLLRQQHEISQIKDDTAAFRKKQKTKKDYESDEDEEDEKYLKKYNKRIQQQGKKAVDLLEQMEEGRVSQRTPTKLEYSSNFEVSSTSTPIKEPDSLISLSETEQSYNEILELEERINSLKSELYTKKMEAKNLLRSKKLRKKEALVAEELQLRKKLEAITDVIEKQKLHITTKLRNVSPTRSVSRGDYTDRSHLSLSRGDRTDRSHMSLSRGDRTDRSHMSLSRGDRTDRSHKLLSKGDRTDRTVDSSRHSENKDDTSVSISISEDQSYNVLQAKTDLVKGISELGELEAKPDFLDLKDASELMEINEGEKSPSKKSMSIEEDISAVSDESLNDTSVNFSMHSFKDLPSDRKDSSPDISEHVIPEVEPSQERTPSIKEDVASVLKNPPIRETSDSELLPPSSRSNQSTSLSSTKSITAEGTPVIPQSSVKESIAEEVSDDLSRSRSARKSLQEYLDGLSPQLSRIPTTTSAKSYTLTFDQSEEEPCKDSEHAFITDFYERSAEPVPEDQESTTTGSTTKLQQSPKSQKDTSLDLKIESKPKDERTDDTATEDFMSDSSLSASKTMSELENLVSSNRKDDTSDATIEEDITPEAKPKDESEEKHQLIHGLMKELMDSTYNKMLKVRQNKLQKELNSSPKYMERSPTSPLSPESPTRGEPALFNDTMSDLELEQALSLARNTVIRTPSPEEITPVKVTVQNTASMTRNISRAVTEHLVSCLRSKQQPSLDNYNPDVDIPEDFTEVEREQALAYHRLVAHTTEECFNSLNLEYNLENRPKEVVPPWRHEAKRLKRPHWMSQLPTHLDLNNIELHLPDVIAEILGLNETSTPRKHHHMEDVLSQEVKDEDLAWVIYDSDELAVKFRIADSIFEGLLQETINIFSDISTHRKTVY